MQWIESLLDWAQANESLLWWSFAGSVAVFLLTPIAVGWAVICLPVDYFVEKKRQRRRNSSSQGYAAFRPVVVIAKNLVGIVLLLMGVVMLLIPGQGLLTIAVGLILVDFPGKFRIERWIATRRAVWRSINWLRRRAGREPLTRPQ